MSHPYTDGLDKNPGNYVPLSPLSFLRRTAAVYPDRVGLVHGDICRTWAQIYRRCRCLAGALSRLGVGRGDTVALMAPNIPAAYEMHFAAPMLGAVLNALNTRLDAASIAFMLEHGQAKVLVTDREFSPVVAQALGLMRERPRVIDVDDPLGVGGEFLGEQEYEAFVASGDADFSWDLPPDEWDAIALNYTSGTTGNPKGVVLHHRGAYLNAVSNVVQWSMPQFPVYLWTLPMFHCNGWCFPWTVALQAGVNVCLRRVEAQPIFDLIRTHRVTHYCGAPVVHALLINAPPAVREGIAHKVYGMIAGAAPPQPVIEGMERMGFDLTHVYGLTEVYGPAAACAKHPEWEALTLQERAERNSRQGVTYALQEDLAVMDPDTLQPVPHDGKTMGEIFFRGNITMKGYLKNPKATQEAFAGGWYHTGDLAVVYPDGYVKIRDRSKDIIISGGENISTLEVEEILYKHPDVLEAAVVAKPDEKWGETPCAFVTLKAEARDTTAADIIAFCRANMAHYKAPKTVVFGALSKTSTGKIQKNVLRERAKDL